MKKLIRMFAVMIAVCSIATEAFATQTVDTTATVVCGKSEQATPCILILNRSVPSYELTIKKDAAVIITFKAERVKDVWKILGEKRKGRITQVVVDTKDASYVVFNPRLPYIDKGLVPDGCDGLIIKTVEVKP